MQTYVRWINTPVLKERWVYRGPVDSSWFPSCEHYCELMKQLGSPPLPIVPLSQRVYVSCSGEGQNIEDLSNIVLSEGTPYNCATNTSCMFYKKKTALVCVFKYSLN